MTDCVFCNNEFQEFVLKSYQNWEIQLFRDDQYYIGRTAVVLKNRHIENMVELTQDEREELFDLVLPDLVDALDTAFSPDHYNYTSLGNDCRHLHFHVIPRYKTPVTFAGQEFEDEYWNQTYSQEYEKIRLNSTQESKLKNVLKENL